MSFSKEGSGRCTITAVDWIEPRFEGAEGGFELEFKVKNAEGEEDSIFLEISQRYGQKNNAGKTQHQITRELLDAAGWTGGDDFSNIEEMVGKEINYNCVKNKKGYLTVYMSQFSNVKISKEEALKRLLALTKGAPSFQQPATQTSGGASVFD